MSDILCPGRERLLEQAHSSYLLYLQHCRRMNYALGTLAGKRCNLYHFQQWLQSQGIESPLNATSADLERFIRYLSLEYTPRHNKNIGKGSLTRYTALLKRYYGFLVKERLLLSSPAEALRYPRKEKRLPKDVLTPEEFKLLLLNLSARTPHELRDAVAIRILMFSGMRLSELCHIDVDEVNLKEREIIIRQGKGMRDRIAFFDHTTQKWLAQYLVSSRPQLALPSTKALIVSDSGAPVSSRQIQKIVAAYLRKSKIRKHITPHSFRRTLCSSLLQVGLNLKVISEIAGHQNLSTTAKYTEIDTETLSMIYQQGHPRA